MLIEAATHEEKLPEVDYVVDIYSVIAKFLNNIKYEAPIVFPLPKNKFMDLQAKLHQINTGKEFHYDGKVKEFDATFEGRLFTFIKIDDGPAA
jgi:hypothetical protein